MASSPAGKDLEKQEVKLNNKSGDEIISHHHTAQIKDRLRHFLHPNGKRIHIASSPEEADSLRRRLSQVHKEGDFDVYISGTSEHLEALREAQNHHEDRRQQLRNEHQEVYERFADVHAELDALANELERVSTHGVALEAHFDKYGYNARVRSYDDGEGVGGSGGSTPRNGNNLLPSAASLRLYDCSRLLHFIITFTLSWKIWNDMSIIVSWFETDDCFQRFSILFLLACLFGYTTNLTFAFPSTYASLTGFYLAARLYMALYLLLCGFLIPMIRPIMLYHFLITLLSSALWITSIHIAWPSQLALILPALFIDLIIQPSYPLLQTLFSTLGPKLKTWFNTTFQVYPAINIEHRTARTDAFVSLVFGYTVVAILYQSTTNNLDSFYGKGILGLIQCFIFNWIYFEIDASNLHSHAIRRHKVSALIWALAHLPFIMMFVLGGSGLSRLVAAHDEDGAHVEMLTEEYQERSAEIVEEGIRWFYCVGFGVALMFMGLISVSHVHREQEGVWLRKRGRVGLRAGVAVVIVCLPLAEGLNSLELVGTVTGLLVLLLGAELWTGCDKNEKLVGRGKACQYVGQCGKKDMQRLVRGARGFGLDGLVADKEKNSGCTVGP